MDYSQYPTAFAKKTRTKFQAVTDALYDNLKKFFGTPGAFLLLITGGVAVYLMGNDAGLAMVAMAFAVYDRG